MRLIDADALLAELGINDLDCTKCDWCGRFDCVRGSDFRDACNAIKDAPTVDAVAVVRCEDCKHYDYHHPSHEQCIMWKNARIKPNVDFCSYGERRSDETD